MTSTTRFAPSPTGLLHLGHAYAAFFAAGRGARFVVRIEDIDGTRCKKEFETAIFDDLAWLGLSWEKPVWRQSERMAAYGQALESLKGLGLVYPCFCTRAEIAIEIARAGGAPHGPEGPPYPGLCRSLSEAQQAGKIAGGVPYALRLDVQKAAARTGPLSFVESGEGETGRMAVDPLQFGDIVLARKDTPAAYHLAVVVDDAAQGVSLVTRGADLFSATHIQRVLQTLLGLPEPAYAHHRLILDAAGKKFSKRDHAVTLQALRQSGVSPGQIRKQLGLA